MGDRAEHPAPGREAEPEDLWVLTDGFGRCRLDGNPHTFPGRIRAWSETLGEWVTISKSDVLEASPEAWAWIAGYLAGGEPSLGAFLGINTQAAARLDESDPAVKRWELFLDAFRTTGALPAPLPPRPLRPPPADLSVRPWSLAGGEVLRWVEGEWVAEQPQARLLFGLLAESPCGQRGFHELEDAADGHTVCIACGYLTEDEG